MQVSSFLRLIIGLSPKPTFVLGRPVPPALRRWTPLSVQHDRRVSAGIFAQRASSKSSPTVYRIAIWKAFQHPSTTKWIVTTTLFPDEIDPALRLLDECRRALPLTDGAA